MEPLYQGLVCAPAEVVERKRVKSEDRRCLGHVVADGKDLIEQQIVRQCNFQPWFPLNTSRIPFSFLGWRMSHVVLDMQLPDLKDKPICPFS